MGYLFPFFVKARDSDTLQLVGRPLIDDNVLINYLNNRYGVSL